MPRKCCYWIYANGVGIAVDDEKAARYFKRSSAISRTGYSEYWAE